MPFAPAAPHPAFPGVPALGLLRVPFPRNSASTPPTLSQPRSLRSLRSPPHRNSGSQSDGEGKTGLSGAGGVWGQRCNKGSWGGSGSPGGQEAFRPGVTASLAVLGSSTPTPTERGPGQQRAHGSRGLVPAFQSGGQAL